MNNRQKVLELAEHWKSLAERWRAFFVKDTSFSDFQSGKATAYFKCAEQLLATLHSADPAGDELKLRVQYCRVYEALLKEYPDSARDVREYVDFLATERMRLWEESRLARSQRQCGCGLDTCKESWEPGCGLGTSIEHAVPVDAPIPDGEAGWVVGQGMPQRQRRAVAWVPSAMLDPRKAQDFFTASRHQINSDSVPLYTEQPASAAVVPDGWMRNPDEVEGLATHLEQVAYRVTESGDVDVYDQGCAMAAEVIRKVLQPMLAAAPDRSQSGGGA